MPEEDEPRCTLIVAPVSVIANWKTQIEQFVEPDTLEVAIYHGSKRESILNQVKRGELDIVMTSYETLVSDLAQLEEVRENLVLVLSCRIVLLILTGIAVVVLTTVTVTRREGGTQGGAKEAKVFETGQTQ